MRLFIAVLGLGALLFNAALMLSDRAPAITRRIGGDVVARLSARLDADSRPARLATDPRLPASDTIVHIGVWATAMVFVGLAVWSWPGLVIGAALVLMLSAAIEIGQGRYTDTRVVEMSDIVANAVGVAVGSVMAAGCYLLWSAGASLLGAGRRNMPRTTSRAPRP